MKDKLIFNKDFNYKRVYGKISSYTTTYNCLGHYPFEEAIKSTLGFADECVVLDGCSTDGTYERLQEMAAADPRIQIYQNEFPWDEPGADGLQKAFARALCSNEFLVQFDVDEVFHEDDYEKWKMITKRFPVKHDILHLPVVELWGNLETATGRRHIWKWRMSRNKPEITHGINQQARQTNPETGKVFARKGFSDGCEYVNTIDYSMLGHTGFYNAEIEHARHTNPEQFASIANQVYTQLPSVWHTSWLDLESKVKQLTKGAVWDKMWSLLYQEETQKRFNPEPSSPEEVSALANKLNEQGGEDEDQLKFKFVLQKKAPKLLQEWWNKKHVNGA